MGNKRGIYNVCVKQFESLKFASVQSTTLGIQIP